jgi:hypothetical protein
MLDVLFNFFFGQVGQHNRVGVRFVADLKFIIRAFSWLTLPESTEKGGIHP